jgi:hypothetical protein
MQRVGYMIGLCSKIRDEAEAKAKNGDEAEGDEEAGRMVSARRDDGGRTRFGRPARPDTQPVVRFRPGRLPRR